jgi:hypothetical protein
MNRLFLTDKWMEKVLVEVDIHAGLWKPWTLSGGASFLPSGWIILAFRFTCSICRRTGHLQRDCSQFVGTFQKRRPFGGTHWLIAIRRSGIHQSWELFRG